MLIIIDINNNDAAGKEIYFNAKLSKNKFVISSNPINNALYPSGCPDTEYEIKGIKIASIMILALLLENA